jgi:hypothetical protein
MTDTPLPPPAWHADPSGRHRLRFWDGTRWTEYVSDQGETARDPLPATPDVVGLHEDVHAALDDPAASETEPIVIPDLGEPPPSVEAASPALPMGGPWATSATSTGAPPSLRRSIRRLAAALTVVLWISVALGALGVAAFANRVAVVGDILDFEGRSFGALADLQGRADDADTFVGVSVLLTLASLATVFVLLVIWMWRIAKNNELLGRVDPRFRPGWTIGGWFVPLASLVIPVMVMQDLWRGTDPASRPGDPTWRSARRSAVVGWWWVAYLVSFLRFAGSGSEAVTRSELETLRTTDTVAVVGSIASIVAAILLVKVVRSISRRQDALFGAVGS